MLEVLVHIMNDVTSEDLVEDALIELDDLASDLSSREVEERCLDRSVRDEGLGRPRLSYELGRLLLGQLEC